MTPKTKTIIIIASSLLLLGAAIGGYHYFSKKNEEESTTNTEEEVDIKDLEKQGGGLGNVDESEYSKNNPVPGSTTLKIGSKGRRVAVLQALLNHYKGENLDIDGVFGDDMRKALAKYGNTTCLTNTQKLAIGLPVYKVCEMPLTEFATLFKKTITDPSFQKAYNPKVNNAMKAVYEKYSS